VTKPLIGLTTYREQARWGVWDQSADLLPSVYAKAIEAVGGVAVLLPPQGEPGSAMDEAARAVVGRLDGLVISGGADVDPAAYAEEPHPTVRNTRADRDAWELALLTAAEQPALPTLGVCRGMQVMAVHAGGRLEQHLPDVVGHAEHNPQPGVFGTTGVTVIPGTVLHGLVGDMVDVHCHHHQSVADHPGFVPCAWAEDGTLEAMERRGDRLLVAVQWHPEVAADAGLFRGLVRAAQSRVGRKSNPRSQGDAPDR
jgi:putative glutamine amidotransferase